MKYNVSEIIEVIENRRTIKPEDFSDRVVHREIVEKLLNAAKWAPTHGLTQPWHFKVFEDEQRNVLGQQLAKIYKQNTEQFNEKKHQKLLSRPLKASVVIALCMRRQETGKIPEIEEIAAVSCAVQNMMLLATAYGIGSFWASPKISYSKQMLDFLNLSEKDKCLGFLYLGYPKSDWPKGQRKPIEYFTEFK